MNEFAAVAAVTLVATVSPGPDFAMVSRNSLLFGRRWGLWSAAGIALGVQVHVAYTMFGVSLLLAHTPAWFGVLKWLGAAYLVFIGARALAAHGAGLPADGLPAGTAPSRGALRTGFMTNALNPKTTLFVISTYTQVVGPATPLLRQFGYGLLMSAVHLGWFALVALLLSQPRLRQRVMRHRVAVDRLTGAVLVGLGLSLALAGVNR
ncbi:LysE family translocator [Eleftheria terrae]|uniref:LysE family translocator n=1 Tax=Eleftheria terrae TaxID=1597781 RepID=UPI00263B96C6|nr:LysE family transporter [Eleftheria terrae]WKB55034.1 LysE family transporter [Eleftheria terrae]